MQVTMDWHVLEQAAPDLADLRLVDDAGLEVPSQVITDRSVPAAAWPYQVAGRGTAGKAEWWVLDLGAVRPATAPGNHPAGTHCQHRDFARRRRATLLEDQ